MVRIIWEDQSTRTKSRTRTSEDDACTRIRGSDWARLGARAKASILDWAFEFWRRQGFPYYRLSLPQVAQEFSTLLEKDPGAVFNGKDLRTSNAGLRLANSFQPGMWSARVNRYHSPMQVFKDDALLKNAIKRSFMLWPDRFGANASCLRRILKTYPGAASVSNYRPMIAKAIIARYCPKGGTVIDFAAGYGGRLLGAIAAHRDYIGIEPNHGQIRGFVRMAAAIARAGFPVPELKFITGTAEEELQRLKSESATLVFSSPPFFNWEHYSRSHHQSFKRYPTYDVWLRQFMVPAIEQSYRLLSAGGYLALNVTNGNRRPTIEDVTEATRNAGFRRQPVLYQMVFPRVPYLHPRNSGPVKRELVMIFQK